MPLEAAAMDRMLGPWGVNPQDANEQYADGALTSAARGEWLYDNDALGHAIVETILAGGIGQGLKWKCLYYESDDGKTTPAEKAVRIKAQKAIERATMGTRFDASGQLTRNEMSKVMLAHTVMTGDSWSIKQWMPKRPGRQVQATCARIVHSTRICNPYFGADTDRMFQGIELDENGTPIAVHVLRNNRFARRLNGQPYTWTRVKWFDDNGWPNLTHLTLHRHPDQLRSPTWFAPVMSLLRMFGSTLSAKMIADRLKASMGLIVECEDPEGMADVDRNGVALTDNQGAMLTGTTKIVPGKIYYVRKGTNWKQLDFQYNGQDFSQWGDVLVQLICASFRVPFEFVQQRLTKTNMAASRVALMQAYDTFNGIQNGQIAAVEDPWNSWILIEAIARGDIVLSGADEIDAMDRLLTGTYTGPARHMPDPLKEGQAHALWYQQLGRDLSGIYANGGLDFEPAATQREADDQVLEDRGIQLVTNQSGQGASADSANQTGGDNGNNPDGNGNGTDNTGTDQNGNAA